MKITEGILIFALFVFSIGAAAAKEYTYVVGDKEDVSPKLFGPVLDLGGGGGDAEGAMQAAIDQVRGCSDCATKLDVVVFVPAPASYVPNGSEMKRIKDIYGLKGVDSVVSIIIAGPDPVSVDLLTTIADAELVFFDGGNQCDHLNNLRGPVLKAIETVYKRGGGIGGMSAGQAIQGAFAFDGCGSTKPPYTPVTSELALANPYDPLVTFRYGFFRWRFLENTITDQHVVKRKRLGRTFTFLARQIQDGKAKKAFAIAVDESTSVIVGKDGLAKVVGKSPIYKESNGKKILTYGGENAAYFVTADHKPEVCEKGKPLTYSNFKVWKVVAGQTFNLKKRPKTGYYSVSVKEGKLDRDPY